MKLFKVIKNIFKSIKIAIKHPETYDIIDEAINGEWYDYGYLYNLEKKKLIEMKKYFDEHGIAEGKENVVKKIDLAIKLLEIANEEENFFGYRFLDEERLPYSKNLDDEYYCKVKVNVKNVNRFFDTENNDFLKQHLMKHPDEIYIKKAQYLYHKLRYYFEQYWWD